MILRKQSFLTLIALHSLKRIDYRNDTRTRTCFSMGTTLRNACILSKKQSSKNFKDRYSLTFSYLSHRYLIRFLYVFILFLYTREFLLISCVHGSLPIRSKTIIIYLEHACLIYHQSQL